MPSTREDDDARSDKSQHNEVPEMTGSRMSPGSSQGCGPFAASEVEAQPAEDRPIRVLLVLRHKLVRQAIAVALAENGFTVLGEANSTREAQTLDVADVIVLEPNLADGSGLDLIASGVASNPSASLLALVSDDTEADAALRAGARAVVATSVSLSTFFDAIQRIASHTQDLNDVKSAGIVRESDQNWTGERENGGPIEPLTNREYEIMQSLIEGLGDKQIATQLGISARTVETHISNICRKLGAKSRLQALVVAQRRQLVDLRQTPKVGYFK